MYENDVGKGKECEPGKLLLRMVGPHDEIKRSLVAVLNDTW